MDPVTAIFNFLATPAGQQLVSEALKQGISLETLIGNLIGFVLSHPLIKLPGKKP